jgi:Protein of unknown function (DUF742)
VNDEVGQSGARPQERRMIPSWQPRSVPRSGTDLWRFGGRHSDGTAATPGVTPRAAENTPDELLVRPFLLTGGRTCPGQEGLRIESLIQTRVGASNGSLRFEARQIFELCTRPNSVAEVAAALHVPVGVARVLVSDLIAEGVVTLLQNEELSVQMIERIRDRVRAL